MNIENTSPTSDNHISTDNFDHQDVILIVIIIIIIFVIFYFFNSSEKFNSTLAENKNQNNYQALQNIPNSYNTTVGPAQFLGDINFPYLTPPQTDRYQDLQNIHTEPTTTLTADDRTVRLMNKIGKDNYEEQKNISCNMLGLNNEQIDNYRNDYLSLYAHQIDCPKKCNMNELGMKKCNLEPNSNCNGVFTSDYNNPDTNALNYNKLLKVNSKDCSTCTKAPIPTPLNRQFTLNSTKEMYNELPESTKTEDKERRFNKKVTDANISNYVDFENNVYQNSIGETPVDKMAAIRTCETGTCGLRDYGVSIANVYDNLISTPFSTAPKSCDPSSITGILDDASYTDMYAPV